MKLSSIPKSGREGSVVYVNSRHGKVARQHVRPRNPRTPEQQGQAMLAISPKAETFTCQVNPPPELAVSWRFVRAFASSLFHLAGYCAAGSGVLPWDHDDDFAQIAREPAGQA